MDNIAKYIDEKKDVAYLIGIDTGIDIGIDKGKEVVIKNLLLQTDFGVDKIANLTNVAVDLVERIKQELEIED